MRIISIIKCAVLCAVAVTACDDPEGVDVYDRELTGVSPKELSNTLAQAQAEGAPWQEIKEILADGGDSTSGCAELSVGIETCCAVTVKPGEGRFVTCCHNNSDGNKYWCDAPKRRDMSMQK